MYVTVVAGCVPASTIKIHAIFPRPHSPACSGASLDGARDGKVVNS